MPVPHRQWLAAKVLSDQQTISYRTLARAVKVHVNTAKRMLYDFHVHENAKKPGSVHATYLLAGTKKIIPKPPTPNRQNGDHTEDQPMPSSPPPFTSSMLQSSQDGEADEAEISPIRTITLVREESLNAVKSSYETITSIHIYSLSAYRLQDLQTLSDVSRHLYNTYFVKEDPLEHNATYGIIVNKNVRRSTRRGPRPPSVSSRAPIKAETTSKVASNPVEKAATTPQPPLKKEETSRPSSAGSATTTSTTRKQSSLKRDTSDIFKAFAKGKNAAARSTPQLSRNGTDSSIGNSEEDKDGKLPTASDDEGESEEEALFLDTKTRAPSKKRASTGRAEREAKLRKMMDDSDEEMEDAQLIDPEEAGYGKGDQPKKDGKPQEAAIKQGTGQEDASADEAEAEAVNWSDSDTEQRQTDRKETARAEAQAEAEAEPADNPPKRRRGKRKVMKKKTLKDDEGYLVTREEAVWESFSEDEPAAPPATKTKTKSAAGASQSQSQSQSSQGKGAAKGGGTAAAAEKGKQKGGGGGNIMKFFGKK